MHAAGSSSVLSVSVSFVAVGQKNCVAISCGEKHHPVFRRVARQMSYVLSPWKGFPRKRLGNR